MKRIVLAGAGVVGLMIAFGSGSSAQEGQGGPPEVARAVRADRSAPLRELPVPPAVVRPDRQVRNAVAFTPPGRGPKLPSDPARQDWETPTVLLAPTPQPGLSFDGTSDDDNAAVAGGRVVPPDTNGDVGTNHYIQMNNSVFEIFDKQGNTVLGPLANNTLWSGFGGICQTRNDGDPIVFHDQLADRWVFSQFAIGTTGHQCFAVSATSDPTGAYYRYDFEISPGLNGFNDYPKIGMWPDGYYLSANEFGGPSQTFQAPIAVAFERNAMLTGASARFVRFTVPPSGGSTFFSLQPSHWEGAAAPPAGAPNVFAMALDTAAWGGSGSDGYQLWEFAVNWASPSASTFAALGRVPTADFDANLCNYSNSCVPQPSPGERLGTLSQFTMFRLMYRNLNGTQVLVGNHTVDVGNNTAGIRWFELRKSGGWGLHQTGTYAPADGVHRWMGSAAMDEAGNLVLSYSASNSTVRPAVRYTSRAASDPLGTLPGGEVDCVAGGGVQTNSYNRWGDYSAISVDPVEACTFWLTGEYYANDGAFDFKTRICKVTLPCGTSNAAPNVSITSPADSSSFTQGTSIAFAGTASDTEDGNLSGSLAWTSNINGPIGSGASFSTSALFVGTHTITASATDSGGAPGSDSITVTVNASTSTPPAAPSNLTAQSETSGSGRNKTLVAVNLSWTDNSTNEASFVIQRTTETGSRRNKQCGTFTDLTTVGAGETSYRDTGVTSGTTYCYQVKAQNGAGDSAPSNVVTAK